MSTALSIDRPALLARVKSVVIKIGTNALSAPDGRLDHDLIRHFAEQVAAVHAKGIRVTMVSSGAIGAGMAQLKLARRPKDLSALQAAASVGQPRLMNYFCQAFEPHGIPVGQILITRAGFESRMRYLNLRNCIHSLHKAGCVPILNENDAVSVDEIRFGDNDLIAAHVTNLLRADLLMLLTVVDGLLDADGRTVSVVQDVDVATGHVTDDKSSRGTGGMGSKLYAAGTVKMAGEPVLIANGKRPNVIVDLLSGADTGTLIVPSARRMSSRSRWIGMTARTLGMLTIDAGAAAALRRNKSLLASGITAVAGEFRKGDPVAIIDPTGATIARGLSNYNHDDLAAIKGHKSSEFAKLLGTDTFYDEVVHRDNLVVER